MFLEIENIVNYAVIDNTTLGRKGNILQSCTALRDKQIPKHIQQFGFDAPKTSLERTCIFCSYELPAQHSH